MCESSSWVSGSVGAIVPLRELLESVCVYVCVYVCAYLCVCARAYTFCIKESKHVRALLSTQCSVPQVLIPSFFICVCCVQELALPIIENEIFGEVAEAKEVAQFAMNYKEAKKVGEGRFFLLDAVL